jgi:hypothetical protein
VQQQCEIIGELCDTAAKETPEVVGELHDWVDDKLHVSPKSQGLQTKLRVRRPSGENSDNFTEHVSSSSWDPFAPNAGEATIETPKAPVSSAPLFDPFAVPDASQSSSASFDPFAPTTAAQPAPILAAQSLVAPAAVKLVSIPEKQTNNDFDPFAGSSEADDVGFAVPLAISSSTCTPAATTAPPTCHNLFKSKAIETHSAEGHFELPSSSTPSTLWSPSLVDLDSGFVHLTPGRRRSLGQGKAGLARQASGGMSISGQLVSNTPPKSKISATSDPFGGLNPFI